ncbi:MAG: helix-turn-helix transcriptional regulator [Deinococcota bacterium]
MANDSISEFVLNDEVYVLVSREHVAKVAPHLLDLIKGEPYVLDRDDIPISVFLDHKTNGVSMIQAWRNYLNLSQEDVAARMGVSLASFVRTEKAKKPRKETLKRVTEAMGLECVEQLLGE